MREADSLGFGVPSDVYVYPYLPLAMPAVVVRQRKAWRRRDGVFLYFEVRTVDAHLWGYL